MSADNSAQIFEEENIISMYFAELADYPPLTAEQEAFYARQVVLDDPNARKMMINSNLRYVASMAKKYVGNGLSFLDLVEEGNLGLMKAVDKFDPDKKKKIFEEAFPGEEFPEDENTSFRFATYATFWIKQGLVRAIQNQAHTIRIPIPTHEKINKLSEVVTELENDPSRHDEQNEERLAELMEVTTEKLKEIMKRNQLRKTQSLNAPLGNESDDKTFIDTFSSTVSSNPAVQVEQQSFSEKVSSLLDGLTDKQREVIEKRFGMAGNEESTLEEVGRELGVTRERVRQIQAEALKILRSNAMSLGVDQADLDGLGIEDVPEM